KFGESGHDPHSVKRVDVTVHFKPNVIQGTMKSLFWIKPSFTFIQKSEFTPDKLAYRDESVGDDVGQYRINIKGDDGSSAALTFAVNPYTIHNTSVNHDLCTVIAGRFQASSTGNISITFTITQSLMDKDNPSLTRATVHTFLAV